MFEIIQTYDQDLWSVEEIKKALRISHDYDDDLVANLIKAAINFAEEFTGLCLIRREVKFSCKKHISAAVQLKYLPVFKIDKIICNDKELQTEDYYLKQKLGKIHWKSEISCDLQIFYISGFDRYTIPALVRQGILEHVSNMYDKPEGVNTVISEVVRGCYTPYRFIRI